MHNAFSMAQLAKPPDMQSAFAAALFDPALPAPPTIGPAGRFAVYRNNVISGLTAALAAGFPAVQAIVGEDFFAAMAQAYIRVHPPRSPVLLQYGESFGDFIAGFAPAASLPYLPDVARLEAAYTRVFHAADAVVLPAAALTQIDAGRLDHLRLVIHPAVAMVRSPHPVATIWLMNTGALPVAEIVDWRAEDALLCRPELGVNLLHLAAGQARFITGLQQDGSLAQAAAAAAAETDGFDLAAMLVLLFSQGLITHWEYAA